MPEHVSVIETSAVKLRGAGIDRNPTPLGNLAAHTGVFGTPVPPSSTYLAIGQNHKSRQRDMESGSTAERSGSDFPIAHRELSSSKESLPPLAPLKWDSASEPAVYDSVFWSCYLANGLMMTALSMLARYADYVRSIGGDATQMGWIVGVGALGAMLARLFQGQWIDRVGSRFVWLACLAVSTLAMLAHLPATSAYSPYIFAVRLVMWTAVAGNFSASITLVSRRAPLPRVAEAVGTLGSSGFVGLALGPLLADWILALEPSSSGFSPIRIWVMVCAGILVIAWGVVFLGARGERSGSVHESPSLIPTVRSYSPWPLVLMSVVTGAGLNLPTYFVRPFAEDIGIDGVGTFFVAYGIAAFGFRWLTRTWPQRFGNFPVIIAGASVLVISVASYLGVSSKGLFIVPAVFLGLAHALLFPAVVGGISIAFPERYRGLGTTLALAAFDMGNLVGTPMAGEIIRFATQAGWDPYATMFLAMGGIYGALTLVFAATQGKSVSSERM